MDGFPRISNCEYLNFDIIIIIIVRTPNVYVIDTILLYNVGTYLLCLYMIYFKCVILFTKGRDYCVVRLGLPKYTF